MVKKKSWRKTSDIRKKVVFLHPQTERFNVIKTLLP